MAIDPNLLALASFAVITTFTPGPNNISSAAMGIRYGYKSTLPYLGGIVSGFFIVMLLSGWVSAALLTALPSFEGILRIAGALYILYLAWHTLRASYSFSDSGQDLFGFTRGGLLQLLNPKAIIYGLTIFATFLSPYSLSPTGLLLAAAALSALAFTAVSTWTLFGAGIRKYLDQPRLKQALNLALALLLVYTAFELSGLMELGALKM